MNQNPSLCFWTNSPVFASRLGPGVKPKIALWDDQSGFQMEVLWELAWLTWQWPLHITSHLGHLADSPALSSLILILTATLSCLPMIVKHGFSYRELFAFTPISFHLAGFSPALHHILTWILPDAQSPWPSLQMWYLLFLGALLHLLWQ